MYETQNPDMKTSLRKDQGYALDGMGRHNRQIFFQTNKCEQKKVSVTNS